MEKLCRSVALRRLFLCVVDGLFLPLHGLPNQGGDVERLRRCNFRTRQLEIAEVFRLLPRVRDNHLTIMLAVNATCDSIPARQSSRRSLLERMIYWVRILRLFEAEEAA